MTDPYALKEAGETGLRVITKRGNLFKHASFPRSRVELQTQVLLHSY